MLHVVKRMLVTENIKLHSNLFTRQRKEYFCLWLDIVKVKLT